MELMLFIYLVLAAVIVFGLSVAYLLIKRQTVDQKVRIAEESAKKIVEDAKREAETKRKEALIEAKDESLRLRSEFEKEYKERKAELSNLERRLGQKEDHLDEKEKQLENEEKTLKAKAEEASKIKEELDKARIRNIEELEKVAKLSQDEAKSILLSNLEKDIEKEASILIRNKEEQIKKEGDRKAREILITAIQRCAVEHVAESTVTAVELPSDDLKGRIIGKEGRNIRAFENATGVDLIVDDTPGAVILASFDPLRRETARLTLEKLISDGRIHPSRVEEMYEKSKQEVKVAMWEYGEKAALDADVHNLPPVLIQLLGRLHYRTSYGQNVLTNCVEASKLAGMIASELGVNARLAKRAALLHDIGKAIDQEIEGTHPRLGSMFAQKAGESPEVVHAIAAHHNDEEPKTIEAIIVQVADAISAGRPGARRDTLEAYVKRLEKLEAVANSFAGVERAYAIQAGREIRIAVKPDKIDDSTAPKLAYDIARKIEAELEYPGEIRVTVIRETRASDTAK
ncbi:MAG: ribonuclease Y [Candidatus Margulisiibacteriota bacterium]